MIDERLEPVSPFIADPESAGGPETVVEGGLSPRAAEGAIGRNVGGAGGIDIYENLFFRDGSLLEAVRGIIELHREGGGKFLNDGCSVGPEQGEILARITQCETGVQRLSRNRAVLAGGEDDEKRAGLQYGSGRDGPFLEIERVVGEEVTSQFDGIRIGIVEFKPILKLTIWIP